MKARLLVVVFGLVNWQANAQVESQATDDLSPVSTYTLFNPFDSTLNELYEIKDAQVTFYVDSKEEGTIQKFQENGFPLERLSALKCSFYSLQSDSLVHFLTKASNIGHPIYGFETTSINEHAKKGNLSNALTITFHGMNPDTKGYFQREDYIKILKKYDLYATIQSQKARYFYTYFEGISAREIITRVNALNAELSVKRVTLLFMGCDSEPSPN